jgi:hypothetical protein
LGYSARYHAASLAAVFLALAVGILIGAGLGDDLISDTEENLRESLEQDISDARGEAGELQVQLDRERAFGDRAYPALVNDTLEGRRVGVLAFGELPSEVSADIEDALEPTGAELAQVAVVRLPPEIGDDEGKIEDLGRRLGSQFVGGGGKQLDRLRNQLFVRSSGEGGRLQGVVLFRGPEGELDADQKGLSDALASGMVDGVAETNAEAVAVERSTTDPSTIPFFASFEVATVDSIDLTSGEVALVFTLLGAEGNFGIKETANSLLPELLSSP